MKWNSRKFPFRNSLLNPKRLFQKYSEGLPEKIDDWEGNKSEKVTAKKHSNDL